jgi:hypothetical protein
MHKVTPITMRGLDNHGQREFNRPNSAGNRYWISQQCELNKIPETDSAYEVEVDR